MQINRNAVSGIAAAIMLTLCGYVAAADTSIGDLGRVQGETLLLNAQVKKAEAAAALQQKSQPAPKGASASASSQTQFNVGDVPIDPPVVRMVYGRGAKLYATFVFQSGVMMDATKGDVLLGGYIADVISADRVELTRGKQRIAVGFAPSFPPAPPAAPEAGRSLQAIFPPGFAPTVQPANPAPTR